jgi:hypothetical protein
MPKILQIGKKASKHEKPAKKIIGLLSPTSSGELN